MADQPAPPTDAARLAARFERHREFRAAIADQSDAEILQLLSTSEPLLRDGCDSIVLPGTDATLFVKLVPLCALELEHRNSTRNLFGVPAAYQYRVGGFGAGVWREIEAHEVANSWVLSGQCVQFPLMHGWRVVEIAHPDRTAEWRTKPWTENSVVALRTSAMAESRQSAALFLERVPQNLLQWSYEHASAAAEGVWETEARLRELLAFVNAQSVRHMDAHFENILVGEDDQLFLTDWGLALSRAFDLSEEEQEFFGRHANYDLATSITSLVHSVTAHLYPEGRWVPTLEALLDGTDDRLAGLPDAAREFVTKRGPVALAYSDFYVRLNQNHDTEYPAAEMERLLDA